jgi:hypothetical protein
VTGGNAFAVWLVAGVVVLMGVAAVASRAPLKVPRTGASAQAGRVPISDLSPSVTASPWSLVLISAGAMLALLVVVVHLRRRAMRREPFRTQPPYRAGWMTRFMMVLVPLLVALSLITGGVIGAHRRPVRRAASPVLRGSQPTAPTVRSLTRPATSFDLPAWFLVTTAVLALGGGGVLLAGLLRRRHEPAPPGEGIPRAISAAIEVALRDLTVEPDPRLAIIGAYRRMEAGLAGAGLPRRAAEAPREYQARIVGSLELSPAPLRTLTRLFERARFGLRRIDPSVRDEAIDALTAIKSELGST